jgi:hypothetical protein
MMTALLLLSPSLSYSYLSYASLYPRNHDFFFQDPSAQYWLDTSVSASCATESYSRTPTWSATNEAYTLKLALPPAEPGSVSATLSEATVKVGLTRKIDSCQCQPMAHREIALPYRPRAEDVSLAVDDQNVLTIKLARGTDAKVETSIPLSVATSKKADANEEDEPKTRPLRFIPHESASSESSVGKQEQTALDKFRAAAQASLAVVQEQPGEAATPAPEPAKASEPNGATGGAPSPSGEQKA